jgi:hypothetical protein
VYPVTPNTHKSEGGGGSAADITDRLLVWIFGAHRAMSENESDGEEASVESDGFEAMFPRPAGLASLATVEEQLTYVFIYVHHSR